MTRHETHHAFIALVLSNEFSLILALAAFFLALLYILKSILVRDDLIIRAADRKYSLAMRALNWCIFGGVFLLFGEIIHFEQLETWRATARVALIFLMLPEITYQLITVWPLLKRCSWTRQSPPS